MRWRLVILSFALLLSACSREPDEYSRHLYVFGTQVDITLVDTTTEKSNKAFSMLEQLFRRMHKDWHAWKPDGELYRLNKALPDGKPLPVSGFVLPLIEQSRLYYQQSEGMFNPAIGKLIDLWGFHQDDRPTGPPPSREEVAALVEKHASMDDLVIEAGQVRSTNAAVDLDFGGFAKGYALKLAGSELLSMGIGNSILNAGGDLCAMGSHTDRPWRIGIRHPQGSGVLASVDVGDGECVMTSGNYERYLESEGIHYGHIIDPRTGWPAGEIVSATVIDTNGGLADAAATALSVAGSKDWYRIAKQMKLKYVMVVDEAGTVYMSPAMKKRITFTGTPPANIQLGESLADNP